ncbi:hypothetical protein AAHC03_05094 [Spirometra sp. Aus1]|nr:unnamed protein product [Spirometra erinaceieuropaei]
MSKKYVFKMEMTCEGCANAAKRVLSKLGEGILSVDADVKNQLVTVESTLDEDVILETLKKTTKPVSAIH